MTRRPWKHLLNIADIWANDDIPFRLTEKERQETPGPVYARRDLIAGRIRNMALYVDDYEHPDFDEDLWWIVDELSDVENEDEFDYVWAGFYDWADANRVWVELWDPHKTHLMPVFR